MKESRAQINKQVKLILEKEGLKLKGSRIRQIKRGNVNKIFIYNERYVLRFSDDSTSTKRLIKEAKLLKEISNQVPVPEVYSFGSIDNLGYQLLSYIPGVTLSETWPSLSITEQELIVQQFADILQKLHSTESTSFRTLCIPSIKCDSWASYCDKEFGKITNYLRKINFSRRKIEESSDYYLANREYLTDSSNASLIHGDLYFDNILIHKNRVMAILDFEFSVHAPVEYELYKIEEFSRNPINYRYHHNYQNFMKILKQYYPNLFDKKNLGKKLNLYDFIYTWKAFKYNDEFGLIARQTNSNISQAKLERITTNKISRLI